MVLLCVSPRASEGIMSVTKVLELFLLPPLNILIAGFLGLLLLNRRPKLGKWIIGVSLGVLWILALPVVGGSLLGLLERDAHTPVEHMREAQAIVALGGGVYFGAPEFGGNTVGGSTLERVRLAAHLSKQTGLPVLVSGGGLFSGSATAVAALMKKSLETEFSIPVQWSEEASASTLENAVFSRKMLEPAGVRTIVLVTHAWHMPRAKSAFERAGFKVVPAGTGFRRGAPLALRSFLPSMGGLYGSASFIHEAIGMLWYSLRAIPPSPPPG